MRAATVRARFGFAARKFRRRARRELVRDTTAPRARCEVCLRTYETPHPRHPRSRHDLARRLRASRNGQQQLLDDQLDARLLEVADNVGRICNPSPQTLALRETV